MTRNAIQTSEHISLGALLTAAGGFLEAYSFLTRDEVLANCQSGNLVLTALFAVQGEWSLALRWCRRGPADGMVPQPRLFRTASLEAGGCAV